MSSPATWLIIFAVIVAGSSSKIFSHIRQDSDQFPPPETADEVYFNGSIITMNFQDQIARFVAVSNGKILAVEDKLAKIQRYIRPSTKYVDLQGKTLMPGFIDPHSHFSRTAIRYAEGINISPPPFGPVTSIPQLLSNIKEYIEKNNIPAGEVVTAGGYSDIDMVERRHPNRYDLDSVSTVHPILITHFSLHIVVGNSLVLDLAGYTNSSNPFYGGVIDKFQNGTITGVCRETAIIPLQNKFAKSFDQLTFEEINSTANHYYSLGVTTVQDIIITQTDASVYNKLGNDLPIDVNAYAFLFSPSTEMFENLVSKYPTGKFKIKGGKFILDGSIQGFTALLSNPYWVPQSIYSNVDLDNYTYDDTRSCRTEACGQDNFPAPTLLRQLFRYLSFRGFDIIAHCNGDQAADNMIEAARWAKQHMKHQTKTRVTMIHAQTVREDQLDQMVELNIQPSFFPTHIYLWGDRHYQIFLGPERAKRMNPVGSAARRGMKFTLHNDSPVIMMGLFNGINTILKGVHASVNRLTINGRLLDDGTQKITIYEALKGLTIYSAWQAHEENTKGSIEVGKNADLIILSEDPLKMQPLEIDHLKVEATIKNGKLVFGSLPSQEQKMIFNLI